MSAARFKAEYRICVNGNDSVIKYTDDPLAANRIATQWSRQFESNVFVQRKKINVLDNNQEHWVTISRKFYIEDI